MHCGAVPRLRLLAAACLFAFAGSATAATVSFDFNHVYSGTAPAGSAPWISAVFTDSASNQVRLTLSAGGLTGSENVEEAYFNLDPALALGSLSIGYVSGTEADAVDKGVDAFKADGDGRFDLLFQFSPGSGFDPGESAIYDFSYAGLPNAFSAASFEFLSAPAGGHGPFLAAAHIQDTGGGAGSGWIAPVPLPAPLALLAAALAGLLPAVRWRRA